VISKDSESATSMFGFWSAFVNWNVQQKCLAGLSITFVSYGISPQTSHITTNLVTYNTLFMTYHPNVDGPCHCPQCRKSDLQFSPSLRANSWRNAWSREILSSCMRIHFTPILLFYDVSVSTAIGSITLEMVNNASAVLYASCIMI
jgi:hypothetical protein